MPAGRPETFPCSGATGGKRFSDRLAACLIAALCWCVVTGGGCSRLRLPAIDPTGSQLFAPLPTTTTLVSPLADGSCANCLQSLPRCNCLSAIGSCLTRPATAFPTPAFPPAIDPPACPTPAVAPRGPAGAACEPCVASEPCCGDCADGPRAVLLGREADCGPRTCGVGGCFHGKMPDRGKRGCILLTPQKIVAPVGGEVVLLSGICGNDGYLQINQPLEWMLSPDSVGNIIAVGDDDPGLIGRLAGSKIRPEKRDPSYAIGVTSTKRALITRGNRNPADDVRLEKGQTWLTLSSPSEGTSRVTVLAPESECWDRRKATATIYWVDARWTFPSPQIVPVDTPVRLNTTVNRAEGGLPAAGWIVRYEIAEPELATFEGTDGSDVVEIRVDDDGNAPATLIPTPGSGGTTAVDITVVRPGGINDRLPKLTLGSGQTFVTWSAPGLQVRAGAPNVASYGQSFDVVANVSNPGDQTATGVRVEMQIPPGVTVSGADPFATITPQTVLWDIGSLPAATQLDLRATMTAENSVAIGVTARGDGLSATDSVRVDVFRPSLRLTVNPEDPSVQAGTPARFNIDITNTGDRPLRDVAWLATGDQTIIHEGGDITATNVRSAPLNPGETWPVVVTFIPNTAGRRCINVSATAAGGQRQDARSCVTAINPIPDTPELSVALERRPATVVGGPPQLYRMVVRNNGRAPATQVRSAVAIDPQFELLSATEGAVDLPGSAGGLVWTTARIDPGQSQTFEWLLRPVQASAGSTIAASVSSAEGSRAEDSILVAIDPVASPSDIPRSTPLPPATAPPTIPGGPAPLQGAPRDLGDSAPQLPRTRRSEQLRVRLVPTDNPVRVNQPIRYSLVVQNDRSQTDSELDLQFALPEGVRVERIVPITNPELPDYDVRDNRVLLPLVRTLRPDESIEYVLVLSCNQPKTFDLQIEASSQLQPDPIVQTASTTVIP